VHPRPPGQQTEQNEKKAEYYKCKMNDKSIPFLSFGGMIHNDKLVIPYVISDRSSTFALVSLPELLAELIR
jgi:hypothetical protein